MNAETVETDLILIKRVLHIVVLDEFNLSLMCKTEKEHCDEFDTKCKHFELLSIEKR